MELKWFRLKQRFDCVKQGGLKYLFKNDNQIRNRWGYLKQKKQGVTTKRTNARKRKPFLYARQKGLCVWCQEKFDIKELTVDHIVDLAKGGSNKNSNLRLLCVPCHILKNDHLT